MAVPPWPLTPADSIPPTVRVHYTAASKVQADAVDSSATETDE